MTTLQTKDCRSPRRGGGFILIELLVVIAVLGALMGLVIPSTQAARERARRQACGNNLKQSGLALQSHISARKKYPAGYVSALKANGDDAGPGWAWGVQLLPYMEQTALYDRIDQKANVESPAMAEIRMQSLPAWICPSDGGFQQQIDVRLNALFKPVCQMAAASYVASVGTVRPTCIVCRDNFDGVFGRNNALRPEEITDGTSKTLATGERSVRWSNAVMWGVVAGSRLFDNQNPGEFAGGPGFVLGTTFKDGFNICLTGGLDRNATLSYAESFGSDHPGGSHFSFCDGGVRFVFDSVDPAVMNAMATRASISKEGKEDPVIHESPY